MIFNDVETTDMVQQIISKTWFSDEEHEISSDWGSREGETGGGGSGRARGLDGEKFTKVRGLGVIAASCR